MSNTPEISLIISCYNQESWIRHTLMSAIHQRTDVGFEILVCDDGSTDATFEAVRECQQAAATDIRYIWQADRGFRLSRSRNNGIRCAQGTVVVFVDADSWLRPSCLNDHWSAHGDAPSLVCGMRRTVTATEVEVLDSAALDALPSHRQREHLEQRKWLTSDRPWMTCLGGNFSVRKSPELYFDEQFESWGSEDRDLAFRLHHSGLRVTLLDEPNVIHLRRSDQGFAALSHDQAVAFIENKLQLRRKYPGGELEPSVAFVRYCHLDSRTQRWSIGALRQAHSANDIFQEFEAWQRRRAGVSCDVVSLDRHRGTKSVNA